MCLASKIIKGMSNHGVFHKMAHLKSGKISCSTLYSELMLNQKPLVPDMKQ